MKGQRPHVTRCLAELETGNNPQQSTMKHLTSRAYRPVMVKQPNNRINKFSRGATHNV